MNVFINIVMFIKFSNKFIYINIIISTSLLRFSCIMNESVGLYGSDLILNLVLSNHRGI